MLKFDQRVASLLNASEQLRARSLELQQASNKLSNHLKELLDRSDAIARQLTRARLHSHQLRDNAQ